ncbi:hypothetical protein [Streptomyces syringium]|uniref:hypothetical protein n=1 Tax=Streptomyces syringium TaxID=76729 RepID=UPI003AAEC682
MSDPQQALPALPHTHHHAPARQLAVQDTELVLYGIPVPGALPLTLPTGEIAWARPVTPTLSPAPPTPAQAPAPVPVWAKTIALIALSTSGAGLLSALAIRIAAPGLKELSALVETLTPALLLIAAVVGWIALRLRSAVNSSATDTTPEPAPPVLITGHGGAGGRLLSPGGTGVRINKLTIHR